MSTQGMTRALSALALIGASALMASPAWAEAAGGIGGGGSETVGSWVVGDGPGSGVNPPTGVTCSPWENQAANITTGPGPAVSVTVRVDERGVTWNLYYRACGATVQIVWVPVLPPAALGRIAFDDVVKKLPKPVPTLSPAANRGGFVNFATWLQVTDPGTVSATSSIPGLSATATARIVRIEWAPGDGQHVVCAPFGALPPSPSYIGEPPCGHTYRLPSDPKVTGTNDGQFHGSLTLVWTVSWIATNGASGDLGDARSTAPFAYRVREIQTIGTGG